jgi:hypothetical protein
VGQGVQADSCPSLCLGPAVGTAPAKPRVVLMAVGRTWREEGCAVWLLEDSAGVG